ncbi:MAG: thioredoxin [Thermoleophilia bacterium]|nr:thioredoxin [Thermoleophilia bacterium]
MAEGVMEFTADNFQQEVLSSDVPVLVDFWATWCGPCRTIAPVVEQIAKERQGSLKVGKLDVDQYGAIAQQYGVQGIPFLAVFEGGKVSRQAVGAMPKAQLEQQLGLS